MSWEEGLRRFEIHMRAAGKSPNTISAFLRDLHKFATSQIVELENVTTADLDAFLAGQQFKPDGTPRSPNSLNRLKTALRSFFGWMHGTGIVEVNPASGVRTTSINQKPPVYLTDQEERDLLHCLRDYGTKAHTLRDAAIINLLLDTGIRVGELVSLDVEDIDGKHLRIRRAKGGSPIAKFLPVRTRKAIDAYLRRVRPHLDRSENDRALFLNQQGTRLQARAVQLLVPAWIKRAGIAKPVTPHTLRHTFATSLLNKTGNLLLVQKALGHSNVTTTQIYAHVADSTLETAVESRTALKV